MGGLEAMGPVGRSITRPGVLLEVLLTLGVVLLCQARDSGLPSPRLLILRRSQRSFRRRKLFPLELVITLLTVGVSDDFRAPGPPGPHLLDPQDDCFSRTLPELVSCCSDSFLAAGVTAGGLIAADDSLGLAPTTLSVINDCLCSGTGGDDDEDILLSGVSRLTLDTFLWTGSAVLIKTVMRRRYGGRCDGDDGHRSHGDTVTLGGVWLAPAEVSPGERRCCDVTGGTRGDSGARSSETRGCRSGWRFVSEAVSDMLDMESLGSFSPL